MLVNGDIRLGKNLDSGIGYLEMKRIVWKTKSALLADTFSKTDNSEQWRGGRLYELEAAKLLTSNHEIFFDRTIERRKQDNPLSYFLRLRFRGTNGDVHIFDPYVIAFGHPFCGKINMAIVHHLDIDLSKSSLLYSIFFSIIRKRLRTLDCVVTVSRYWEKYLKASGCKNVRVIYNSFPTEDFSIDDDERKSFLLRYGISKEKPLIYLGPALPGKGWQEAYETLKPGKYQLVVTGPDSPGIPDLLHLNLPYRDYLCLLSVSDVVVAMSTMLEGWNRVVHEAMLCRTPVIGSGKGGMGELLREGGQLIASDCNELPLLIHKTFADRHELGERGYSYVSRFDTAYFANAWRNLIEELTAPTKEGTTL